MPLALETAIFALDYLTGNLFCYAFYPSHAGAGGAAFAKTYAVNVQKDLGVDSGKSPEFVMVTGDATFPSTGSTLRPARTVVYVSDVNSGHIVSYYLLWDAAAAHAGRAQPREARFVPLKIAKVRSGDLPQQ